MPTANDRLNGNCNKVWGLIKLPFRNSGHNNNAPHATTNFKSSCEGGSNGQQSKVTSSGIARVLIPTRRGLRLDPPNKFYFPYEPGKQVQSAIKIKNTSKSHVAFKFQTTAPKSCFMRPPSAILAPGESIIATVFRFVEPPEKNEKPTDRKKKSEV